MEEHVSIKNTKALPEGMDYQALRLQGFSYVQELSGKIWTDYNEHDPGVTLLEHLCFALTDLAFRAGFDIKDILYAQEGHGAVNVDNGFYPPVDILPTAPITVFDYRRLLIDRIRDIRNVWFEPIDPHLRGYKGLFRVRLQLANSIDRSQQPKDIEEAVWKLVMSHRNLCEDLEEIIILETEYLSIAATIGIEGDAFGEKVLANILHALDQELNPGIRFYSQEELLAQGYSIEEVFDGPRPKNGFIKQEDLKPIPESTHVSVLREVIAKVPGVKMIDNLKVWKNGARIRGDYIKPSANSALSLDPRLVNTSGKEDSIKLVRNGVPVAINPQQTSQFLTTLTAKAKKGFQINLDLNTTKPTSTRKQSDLSSYRSFQRLLPAIYGIGPDGLPATANRQRRAQAYQLKAYLLIFEQFMADYLAQLANARQLFSLTPSPHDDQQNTTYFTQFPTDIPDIHHLYYHGLPNTASLKEINSVIREDLQHLSASCDPAEERRNRFLDHLLARFGEVYNDDALKLMPFQSQKDLAQKLIKGKTAFLRQYPDLSQNRSLAFDYTRISWEAWESVNVSGLKKRVALLLNLRDYPVFGDNEKESDTKQRHPSYQDRSLAIAPLLAGAELSDDPAGTTAEQSPLPLRQMLLNGTVNSNYHIEKSGRKYTLYFRDPLAATSANLGAAAGAEKQDKREVLVYTGTEKRCQSVQKRLIALFEKINHRGEGFFFLENILLRPKFNPRSVLVFETRLSDEVGSILLRGLAYTTEKELSALRSELLILTTEEDNWTSLQFDGEWRIILLRNGSPVLISQDLKKQEVANKARKELPAFFKNIRDRDPRKLNNYLRLEPEKFEGFKIPPSFYSLRLSVIAPDWPALFQERAFRRLFQQIIAANIPAHLGVDYYWLEPDEMTTFETLYTAWLEAFGPAKPSTIKRPSFETGTYFTYKELRTISSRSLKLVKFLRPEEKKRLEVNKKEDIVHQNTYTSLITKLGDTFGYSFMFAETDFSIIQGIDQEIINALNTEGVNTWRGLQKQKVTDLEKILGAANLQKDKSEVESWRRQAGMARHNRWKDLLRLQRRTQAIGTAAALQMERPTQVESETRNSIQRPEIIDRIRDWVNNLPPKQPVPYAIMNFLQEALGYSFFLPNTDLEIFSCIDPAHAKALKNRRVNDWSGLATMRERTWKGIQQELESAESTPTLEDLQQEVALALQGAWDALSKIQESTLLASQVTSVKQRLDHHTTQLMGPVADGKKRPLTIALERWPKPAGRLEVLNKFATPFLETLGYSAILREDNFQIFTGIGPATEAALKKVGIIRWQNLADIDKAWLNKHLSDEINAAILKNADDWIVQARLARDNKWDALVSEQKGHVGAASVDNDQGTALERAINAWLDNSNLQNQETQPT